MSRFSGKGISFPKPKNGINTIPGNSHNLFFYPLAIGDGTYLLIEADNGRLLWRHNVWLNQ